jgi:hypothetical protein
MAEPKKPKKKRSTAAPGQYYGYSVVQGARLVHRLLESSPNTTVSIEGLDDIAIEGDAGLLILEQDKSGLSHNPVSNKSIELWKTLRNWLEAIRGGTIPSDTRLVLFVAQMHTGSVVERLHQCKDAADGAILAQELRKEFWGNGPAFDERENNPETLRAQLDLVLGASDEVLGNIFQRFELVQGSGSPYEDIKVQLGLKAIGADAIEPTLHQLVGWCQTKVAKSIESKQLPAIAHAEFQSKLLACARKFDRADKELVATDRTITDQEVKDQLTAGTYIKQLRVIGLETDHLEDAVDDYLRAAADRAQWGTKGHVLEKSFSEYQKELTKNWRRQREAAVTSLSDKPDAVVGKATFLNCMEVHLPLQKMAVSEYFTRGTFHDLADKCTVGWHPRFLELLSPAGKGK